MGNVPYVDFATYRRATVKIRLYTATGCGICATSVNSDFSNNDTSLFF